MQVQSPAQCSGLGIWYWLSCSAGCSCSLDSIPGLGKSTCCGYGHLKKTKKQKTNPGVTGAQDHGVCRSIRATSSQGRAGSGPGKAWWSSRPINCGREGEAWMDGGMRAQETLHCGTPGHSSRPAGASRCLQVNWPRTAQALGSKDAGRHVPRVSKDVLKAMGEGWWALPTPCPR